MDPSEAVALGMPWPAMDVLVGLLIKCSRDEADWELEIPWRSILVITRARLRGEESGRADSLSELASSESLLDLAARV
jgi:hypothetical protein